MFKRWFRWGLSVDNRETLVTLISKEIPSALYKCLQNQRNPDHRSDLLLYKMTVIMCVAPELFKQPDVYSKMEQKC